jgi:DUF4097 and DUF4098 domain-containing protein YvlB
MLNKMTVIVVALLMAALPVFADRVQIDETRKTTSDGEVSVELLAGTITVTGWDRNEVHVTGSYDDDFEEFEIDAEKGEVSIEVDIDDDNSRHRNIERSADLTIMVPRDSEISVEVISADITIEDVTGEVDVEAISGDIECIGGMEEISIECVSGDINIETTAALKGVDIEAVSGNVELRGALGNGARVSVESVNGSVVLRLPSNTSAEFEISTFNGSIKNDFGPQAEKSSKYLPSSELNFSIGGGSARVSVEAFNGTVRLIEE